MGSIEQPQVFLPLDLEIMDRVYEAAWAELEARDSSRDIEKDGERGETLRKLVMDLVEDGAKHAWLVARCRVIAVRLFPAIAVPSSR